MVSSKGHRRKSRCSTPCISNTPTERYNGGLSERWASTHAILLSSTSSEHPYSEDAVRTNLGWFVFNKLVRHGERSDSRKSVAFKDSGSGIFFIFECPPLSSCFCRPMWSRKVPRRDGSRTGGRVGGKVSPDRRCCNYVDQGV